MSEYNPRVTGNVTASWSGDEVGTSKVVWGLLCPVAHRIEWQFKEMQECDRHRLRLLSECPNCGARFKVPALWVDGWCQRCFMAFEEMAKYQKLTQ